LVARKGAAGRVNVNGTVNRYLIHGMAASRHISTKTPSASANNVARKYLIEKPLKTILYIKYKLPIAVINDTAKYREHRLKMIVPEALRACSR